MTKILVVEDEPSIMDLIEMLLKRENFTVAIAPDGKSALKTFKSFNPDIVLLDLMLPDMSGHDVCKEITRDHKTPVIMLTAKNETIDKILGLELGADDYITKPFDGRELVARIKAILRRLGRNTGNEPEIFKHQNLKVNLIKKSVFKNGIPVELTLREYQLLELFVKNPQRVFSREELLTKAWGYDFMGDSRTVDINITRLRKKIEDDRSSPKHIITVYGFGYRFGGAEHEV